MNLLILKLVPAPLDEFIQFWASQYSYRLEHLYEKNISKPLAEPRIWSLYNWKNGTTRIAAKKKKSIRGRYLVALRNLPTPQTIPDARQYLTQVGGGAIWGIFWLHCISPERFPIFDQHTYRAMAKIKGTAPPEIPQSNESKLGIYFEEYIPFITDLGGPSRPLDKALFAYGSFLKNGYSRK